MSHAPHDPVAPYPERVALYAAYGSNLDPQRMAERAPYSPMASTGWLEGWRLTFGGEEHSWEGPLTMVVEEPGASVFVVLYDMHALDEATLDAWEGVALGMWSKIRVRVQTLEGSLLAWLYVLDAYEGGLPTAAYLTMIADAAAAGGAPADYVDQLRQHPST